jgi:hypothetical protein
VATGPPGCQHCNLRLLVICEGVRSTAEQASNLCSAGKGYGSKAAASAARGHNLCGTLLGEEPPEFRIVCIVWETSQYYPFAEGVAVKQEVMAKTNAPSQRHG